MGFVATEVAYAAIAQAREVLQELEKHDSDLANQARRAFSSIALNLEEGNRRAGRDRAYSFRVASGSNAEACGALRIAVAWGYITPPNALLKSLDRLGGLLWGLTHARK